MTTKETEAVKLLLVNVWFAKEAIHEDHIDFAAIDAYAAKIVPSDSETFLIDLARNLWNGSGAVNLYRGISHLDMVNRIRVISAISILAGVHRD